jgi:urea transporter
MGQVFFAENMGCKDEMNGMAGNAWDNLANKNWIAGSIDANLRGASQVFLQNNPLTGLILLVAIFWGAHAAGNPELGLGTVAGLTISTFMAILLRVDRASMKQGLFGFNGILVGVAVPTFLAHHPAMWAYVIIGAAVSTVVTVAVNNVAKTWGVSGSTAPFVFTTWLLLLAAYAFARVRLRHSMPLCFRWQRPPRQPGLPTYSESSLGASLRST